LNGILEAFSILSKFFRNVNEKEKSDLHDFLSKTMGDCSNAKGFGKLYLENCNFMKITTLKIINKLLYDKLIKNFAHIEAC